MSTKSPNDVDRAVGANIRKIRLLRRLSQERLGDALGVTFQQLQKYEKGTNRVGASRLVAIAAVLEVDITELFAGVDRQASAVPFDDPTSALTGCTHGLAIMSAFAAMTPRQRAALAAVAVAMVDKDDRPRRPNVPTAASHPAH